MSEQYDNRGKVAIWKHLNQSNNLSAPILKGTIYAHRDIREGEEIEVSLWKFDSANPKAPVLTGEIQDKYVKEQHVSSVPLGDDEDLPF